MAHTPRLECHPPLIWQLVRLEERHELVQADFQAANDALDEYRDSMVRAEVRIKQDKERMATLQVGCHRGTRSYDAHLTRLTRHGTPRRTSL